MESKIQSLFNKTQIAYANCNYKEASQHLDDILTIDYTNSQAWYEKSKLPILQEDIVIIYGCCVSVSKYHGCDITQKSPYLRQCGLSLTKALKCENYLQYDILIEKEHIKYLENAVRYNTSVNKDYENKLIILNENYEKRGKSQKKVALIMGIVALPIILAVITSLIYSIFQSKISNFIFINIICIAPYILSVLGLYFYTKVINERNKTKIGLTTNLISLIFSNITIIISIIFLIIK
jgi:hypothetical protein